MSGITGLLAKELSSALGITDNPKFNPMFKQTDEVMADVADVVIKRLGDGYVSPVEDAPL